MKILKPEANMTPDEAKDEAVDLAHKLLNFAADNTEHPTPQVLLLACSHFLSHLLMGAPDEKTIELLVRFFFADLNVARIIELNKSDSVQTLIKEAREEADRKVKQKLH